MNQTLSILIIEDEKHIADFMRRSLADYRTVLSHTGKDGLHQAASQCPDLILLDLGLPDMDGMEIIQSVRKWTMVPVIVISARTQEREKVAALDAGADDYITKPFGTEELLARIRTAMRHSSMGKDKNGAACLYHTNGLSIDFMKREVLLEGKEIHLTPIEYKIVVFLAQNSGKVITYDALMKNVWGPFAEENNRILRVNMANIRRKLEKNPGEPEYIYTELGIGYRMREGE